MNATLWLRVSAIISLLFTAGHFTGGLKNWSPILPVPAFFSLALCATLVLAFFAARRHAGPVGV
jgi:membrane protease YdiL (CAAX protease family)